MEKELFGALKGKEIYCYTLDNKAGISAKILEYGGIVHSLFVPDREGNSEDILLGYRSLEEYVADDCYLNCLIGRYANRIAGGTFSLNEKEYCLFCNDGENHLHGGRYGFNKKIWQAKPIEQHGAEALKLEYRSSDGEEGFPGNLDVKVTYTITEAGDFVIEYEAQTDQPTVVCLTWHGYFNLASSGNIREHQLSLNSSSFTAVGNDNIPTGKIETVVGSDLDLRFPKRLGELLGSGDPSLLAGGYDHNFIIDKSSGEYGLAAVLLEPEGGRKVEMFTTEPALQVYSGNFLDGRKGKNGSMNQFGGLCLEAQHYPDSPNKSDFPSTLLLPDQKYYQKTVYRFSVAE